LPVRGISRRPDNRQSDISSASDRAFLRLSWLYRRPSPYPSPLATPAGGERRRALRLPPDELNRVGFRLYEHFRPQVPEGVSGWGAKAELQIEATERAASE